MRRIALHFPLLWKAALHAVLATSWVTGVVWFSLHRWVRIEGEFGEEHSPWEPVLIKIHGASAMLMMIYFGYLLASHVPVGNRARRNKILGWMLVGSLVLLMVTSYGYTIPGTRASGRSSTGFISGTGFSCLGCWGCMCSSGTAGGGRVTKAD